MARDVAVFGDKRIPRIEREETALFRNTLELEKYHSNLQGKDPNTMRSNTALWKNVLEDVALHAPEGTERWSFGKLSGEKGYYFVKYYSRVSQPA